MGVTRDPPRPSPQTVPSETPFYMPSSHRCTLICDGPRGAPRPSIQPRDSRGGLRTASLSLVLCALCPFGPFGSQSDSPSRVEISHIQFYLGKTFGLAVCQPPATAIPATKGTVIPLSRTSLGLPAWPYGHQKTALDARTLHYSFVSPAPRIVSDVW